MKSIETLPEIHKSTFVQRFEKYIHLMYEDNQISKQEYEKAIEAYNRWEFQKIMLSTCATEAISWGLMSYSWIVLYAIFLALMPERPWAWMALATLSDRVVKWWLSYKINKNLWIENHIYFTFFSTLPGWKYPTLWYRLRYEPEIITCARKYIQDSVGHVLSHPISQYCMSIAS